MIIFSTKEFLMQTLSVEDNTPMTPSICILGSSPAICTAMPGEEQNTEGTGAAICIGQESFSGLPNHNMGRM